MTVQLLPLKIEAPKIRITQEEILADLRYPAGAKMAKPAKDKRH